MLRFGYVHVGRVSPSGLMCEFDVTIHATFNPGTGGAIAGGLTAWISPEQRAQYLRGQTPHGEQVYHVKITYRRTAKGWRAVEFDRGNGV